MKIFKILGIVVSMVSILAAVACGSPEPTATPVPAPTSVPANTPVPIPTAKLLSFSNDSPHISVIDAESRMVLETKDVEDLLKWTWNDDNNYFDGTHVWLGLKYPEADDAVVIALDVNTLEVKSRHSIGTEKKNIYIGKSDKNGVIHIGKQASLEIVTIDTKAHKILETWANMPSGSSESGVVCDADLVEGPDGVERFYYPTLAGNSVVMVHAQTGEVLAETHSPDGSLPVMHTNNHKDGRMWVQEIGTHTNAIYDPITLELVKRIPAAQKPVVATFSPDGSLAYIGHSGDPIVQVIDTGTLTEVTRITVGTSPTKIAVHPNGKYIYASASKEASVVVIKTSDWSVEGRITLDSNPGGMFLWSDN